MEGQGFFPAWGISVVASWSSTLWTLNLTAAFAAFAGIFCFHVFIVGKAQTRERMQLNITQNLIQELLLSCCWIFQVLWGQNSRHLHRRGFCIVPVKTFSNYWVKHKPLWAFDRVQLGWELSCAFIQLNLHLKIVSLVRIKMLWMGLGGICKRTF